MNVGAPPPNFANAISPFSPIGKQAVGEENTESKSSTLKSIIETADSSRTDNRSKQNDPDRLIDRAVTSVLDKDDQQKQRGNAKNADQSSAEQSSANTKSAQEKRILEQEQQAIRELSARDREVRNHERAHAAVGGQYAGAPRYTYERGPNGVNYAIGGEVSISTSEVAGNPQATIAKAQQIKRAALAPAEPSPQDRRVAATASQMEAEARRELVELQQADIQAQRESRAQQTEARQSESNRDNASRDSSANQEAPTKNLNLSQRLIEMGVTQSANPSGSVISDIA